MEQNIEIICLQSAAFNTLLEKLFERFKLVQPPKEDKWISGAEAMKMLRIKSRTTLQAFRDEGRIRYSQPEKKIILYDADSIRDLLEDFVYEPFDMPKKPRSNRH